MLHGLGNVGPHLGTGGQGFPSNSLARGGDHLGRLCSRTGSPLGRHQDTEMAPLYVAWASSQHGGLREVSSYRKAVFICKGRHDRVPQTGWLGTTKMYHLTALDAGSPTSRCQQGSFRGQRGQDLLQGSPWLVDGLLLPVSSHRLPFMNVSESEFPPLRGY